MLCFSDRASERAVRVAKREREISASVHLKRESLYFPLQQVQESPQEHSSPQLQESLQTGQSVLDLQHVQSEPHWQFSPQLQASLHTGQVISAQYGSGQALKADAGIILARCLFGNQLP